MKTFVVLAVALTASSAFAQRVYCDQWTSQTQSGFSVYRANDQKDIGNAFFVSFRECREAADAANDARNGIVCSPYRDSSANGYSVYRIRDGKDLGSSVFSDFASCQTAVTYSQRNVFCAPYSNTSGQSGYSFWSVSTGKDIGTTIFTSMDECLNYL